jgi:FkbM family methyltransferase
MIKKIIKNILPYFVVNQYIKYCDSKAKKNTPEKTITQKPTYNSKLINSYSQIHEDLLIDAILNVEKGFYIDIGANDPQHFSNTKRFYDKGWNGINIDPNPKCYEKFIDTRTRDINLNLGISSIRGELQFYELTYPPLSSFSKEMAIINAENFGIKIEKEYKVKVICLKDIYQEYVDNKTVDFISIDTEGHEMQVLEGNNWEKYRPKLLIIETGRLHSEIYDYVISKNYSPIIHNNLNAIFINNEIL